MYGLSTGIATRIVISIANCIKYMYVDPAALARIVGRFVADVATLVKFLERLEVEVLGTNTCLLHYLVTPENYRVAEVFEVPLLEQRHVEGEVLGPATGI